MGKEYKLHCENCGKSWDKSEAAVKERDISGKSAHISIVIPEMKQKIT